MDGYGFDFTQLQRKKKFMLIVGPIVVTAHRIDEACDVWLTLTSSRNDIECFTAMRQVYEPSYVELYESLKDYKRKKDAPTE